MVFDKQISYSRNLLGATIEEFLLFHKQFSCEHKRWEYLKLKYESNYFMKKKKMIIDIKKI